jgi:hypothetical protein
MHARAMHARMHAPDRLFNFRTDEAWTVERSQGDSKPRKEIKVRDIEKFAGSGAVNVTFR